MLLQELLDRRTQQSAVFLPLRESYRSPDMPSFFNLLENPSLYFALSGGAFMLNIYFFLFHTTVTVGADGGVDNAGGAGDRHNSFVHFLLFGHGSLHVTQTDASPHSISGPTSLLGYTFAHGMEALVQSPLLSVSLFNFGFAFILYFYQMLHIVFFSSLPSGIEIRQIVDKLYNFFSFKIFLIGLILEPTLLDIGLWVLWCLLLGTAKALLQHGILKIEAVITNTPEDSPLTGEMAAFDLRKVARPAGHLLYMLLFLVAVGTAWHRVLTGGGNAANNSLLQLWLLVMYDVSTVAIEWLQAVSLYGVYLLRALGSCFDMDDSLYYINLCAEVGILAVTLLHFMHVYLLHGINLSITDVLLCLNVRAAAENLSRKVADACKLYRTKHYFDSIFPTVCKSKKSKRPMVEAAAAAGGEGDYQMCEGREGEGGTTAEDDVCSICLHGYCDSAKLLPCGHSIHTECLKQLLRRATTSPSSGSEGRGGQAGRSSHYSFKCPLCRVAIDASSGKIIAPGALAEARSLPAPAGEGSSSSSNNNNNTSLYREVNWSLFGGLFSFSYTVNSTSNSNLSTLGLTGLQQPGSSSGGYTPSLPYAFSRWSVSEEQINAVADMFPQVARAAIERDLVSSFSVSATVENILEGRVSALGIATTAGGAAESRLVDAGAISTPAAAHPSPILSPASLAAPPERQRADAACEYAHDRRSYSIASDDAPTERQMSLDSTTSVDSSATDASVSSSLASFRSMFRRRPNRSDSISSSR